MHDEIVITPMDQPVIQYRIWSLWERKFSSLVILTLTAGLSLAVYHFTGKTHLAVAVCVLLLGSVWRLFVPMQFELSADGIRWSVFGYHRTIRWSEIRSYVIQKEGILILPHRTRYPLDAIRGMFIPIPQKYRIAVQRRFLFFLEKTE
ncbi:MAG: hypothetical protein FWC43_11695 [Planctomycetaceae bacterium]|nr:hypothetical protein [Planctomycetaceae bacterium]